MENIVFGVKPAEKSTMDQLRKMWDAQQAAKQEPVE
jgi:hypothetical protein